MKKKVHDVKENCQKKFQSLISRFSGNKIPKPGGLYNVNNTCYVNSVIQMLASSEYLIDKLNDMNKQNTESSSVIALLDVLNGVNEEDPLSDNLLRNTERLRNLIFTIKWTKSLQQDSFDLLTDIISHIAHDFTNHPNIEIPLRLKLIHKFEGLKIPTRIQDYLGLSLNLYKSIDGKSVVDLEYLICQHFEPLNVDGDSNKIIELNLYEKPPSILLIHIQANKWNAKEEQMVKSKYHFRYKEEMTLWLNIVTDLKENISHQHEIEYNLTAVLHHIGEINHGHYVTYRKWKGKWYYISDNLVKEKEFARNISPYIMLYELTSVKINDKTNKGPGTLYNRNSVCYMNALIQALASSKITINRFQELSKRYPSNSSLNLLLVLLNDVNENKESVTENSKFLKELVRYINWTKSSQQDAFDLLATFLAHIEKEFPNEKEDCDLPLKVKILHEFQNIKSPNKIQKYLGLSLNLCGDYEKSGVRLDYMINQHFEYSEIDRNSNKLTRMSLYQKAPDVLLIHIQANKLDPTTTKLYKPIYTIKYEEDMTLYFHIVSSEEGGDRDLKADRPFNIEVKYNLKALIEHMGQISCGHFVTYRKWNDKWYLMNDEKAKSIVFKEDICPYIMIYERSSYETDSDLKGIQKTPSDSEGIDQTACDSDNTNQTLNNSKGINQTPDNPEGITQTHRDTEGTNQTPDNPEGINQTPDNPEGINQTPDNPEGITQTHRDTEGTNQTPNNPEGINQTPDNPEGINQTPNNPEGINQTPDNPECITQTHRDTEGTNQTPSDSEDSNRTPYNPESINHTPNSSEDINQTYVDPKGTNQGENDKK